MQVREGIEFSPSSVQASQGGGASTDAGINAGRDITFMKNKPDVLAVDTPEETYRCFMEARTKCNGRWDRDIFTDVSKQHMRKIVVLF